MAEIDLILKDIEDKWVKENFSRISRFVRDQTILDGRFKFFQVDLPRAFSRAALKHNLSFVPRDIIPLSAEGDQNFYYHFGESDRDNIYVTNDGPVILRFLAGLYDTLSTRAPSVYPFVPFNGGTTPPVPETTDVIAVDRVAGSALSALKAVRPNGAGKMVYADYNSTYSNATVTGITLTSAAAVDDPVTVVTDGLIADASFSGFTMNGWIYLGASGALTQTPVGSGFHVVLGRYVGNDQIEVEVDDPIEL